MANAVVQRAVTAIEQAGALLVFPVNNRAEPPSLWHVLHPRTRMRWDWDESADDRVVRLWRLREQLSRSRRVVYTKWFQNRATIFSRDAFVAAMAAFGGAGAEATLSRDARTLLDELEADSPLSPRVLRARCGLEGRLGQAPYERAMKELWRRLLIVGFGEIDDGAFPSLAVGATRVLFEDLWSESAEREPDAGLAWLRRKWGVDSVFHRVLERTRRAASRPVPAARAIEDAEGELPADLGGFVWR